MARPLTPWRIAAARIAVLLFVAAGMTRHDVDRLFLAQEKRSWRGAWRRVRSVGR